MRSADDTGQRYFQRIHPDDRARFVQMLHDLTPGADSYTTEYRVVRGDGSVVVLEEVGQASFDAAGKLQRLVGVTTDITARKQAEEALRQSERLYRGIGEAIDYGVWVCAPDGRNIYASESFLKMVGMTQQQCSDFGWGDVLHPDDAARTMAAWKECVRTGGNWDIEHRFRGVDEQWHDVLARGVPIRDEKGQISCWAGINLDISRLKKAEETLRDLNATLESKVAQRTAQLQQRARQLQKLTLEVSLTEDRERKRMAEILHDDLQQIIAGAKFHLSLLRNRVKYDASLQAIASQIDQMLKDAIEKSRGLSHELSPAILHHGDFTETLGWLARPNAGQAWPGGSRTRAAVKRRCNPMLSEPSCTRRPRSCCSMWSSTRG